MGGGKNKLHNVREEVVKKRRGELWSGFGKGKEGIPAGNTRRGRGEGVKMTEEGPTRCDGHGKSGRDDSSTGTPPPPRVCSCKRRKRSRGGLHACLRTCPH